MDDREIDRLEKPLEPQEQGNVELLGEVLPSKDIGEFCLEAVVKMMVTGGSPNSVFHVMHKGSVYYIDMVVRAIAPPYEARDPDLKERQWFGQRET